MNTEHKLRVHKGVVHHTPRNTPGRRILASGVITRADGRKYERTLHATKGWKETRVFF